VYRCEQAAVTGPEQAWIYCPSHWSTGYSGPDWEVLADKHQALMVFARRADQERLPSFAGEYRQEAQRIKRVIDSAA
jgi:hypothetical protein